MNEGRDLFDETTLRRALRFESDERVPRFDAAALAALSGARLSRRAVIVTTIVCAVSSLAAAGVWSVLITLAPDIIDVTVRFTVGALIAVATVLEPVAEFAAQPAVPFSLLAALGVAIVHTLYERREHAHANAS